MALRVGYSNRHQKRHNLCCYNTAYQALRVLGTELPPLPGCHDVEGLRERDDFVLSHLLGQVEEEGFGCQRCRAVLVHQAVLHPRLEAAAAAPSQRGRPLPDAVTSGIATLQRFNLNRLGLAVRSTSNFLGMDPGAQEDACLILHAIVDRLRLKLPLARDTVCRNQCRACRTGREEHLPSRQITVLADRPGTLLQAIQSAGRSHRADKMCDNSKCPSCGFHSETVITELTHGAGPDVLLIELKRDSKGPDQQHLYMGKAHDVLRRRGELTAVLDAPYTLHSRDLSFP